MRSLLARHKPSVVAGLVGLASTLAMVLFSVSEGRGESASVATSVPAKTVEVSGELRVEAAGGRKEVESEPRQPEPGVARVVVLTAGQGHDLWPRSDERFQEQLEEARDLVQQLEEFLRTGTSGRTKPEQMVQEAENLCCSLMFLECKRHGWYEPEPVDLEGHRSMTSIRIRVPGSDRYASDDPVLEDLDARYDCAYLVDRDAKGEGLVEVARFPRDQYPVINQLNDAVGRLTPAGRSRRHSVDWGMFHALREE